jgi:transcription initiation factor IIE alpha subunit
MRFVCLWNLVSARVVCELVARTATPPVLMDPRRATAGQQRKLPLQLAHLILEADFGEVVASVGLRLLSHGAAHLSDLARALQLPKSQLRSSLLVLIQHNIVSCVARIDAAAAARKRPLDGAPLVPQYEASINEVFVRPLFPRLLMLVRERLGGEEEMLLQELLVCGRLSSEQLMQRATEAYARSRQLAADAPELTDWRKDLHGALGQLQAARFISQSEVIPSALCREEGEAGAPPAPPPAPAAPLTGRKRKQPAAQLPASRLTGGGGGGGGGAPLPLVGIVGGRVAGMSMVNSAVLWRANINRFLLELRYAIASGPFHLLASPPALHGPRLPDCAPTAPRPTTARARSHSAIERLVGDKLDHHALALMRVALSLSSEDSPFEELFTVDDLLAKCPKHFEDDPSLPITWQLVCNYLDAMCADTLCTIASTLNGKYVLKLGELGNAIRQLVLEGVVRQKVGDAGCRLYRILLRRHTHGGCSSRGQQKLELKQIAELALMPERDARPVLMKLLQAELVQLQEVPRTIDRNPKTTTYLWHVSLPHAYATLEAEMMRTLVHLRGRLAHEAAAAARGENGGDMQRAWHVERAILRLSETLVLLRTV